MKRIVLLILLVLLSIVTLAENNNTATQLILEEPVLITSGGQSPGALQMTVVAKMIKLNYTFEKVIKAESLNGADYRTLVIVVGASGKGLGAAGIDIDTEITRVEGLAKAAREIGMAVVICNLEGSSRRGASSDLVLDAVAPYANAFFAKADADADGKFAGLSESMDVPLTFFEKTVDLKGVLQQYFNK